MLSIVNLRVVSSVVLYKLFVLSKINIVTPKCYNCNCSSLVVSRMKRGDEGGKSTGSLRQYSRRLSDQPTITIPTSWRQNSLTISHLAQQSAYLTDKALNAEA